MHTILFKTLSLEITPWTIVGTLGFLIFSSRWVVQIIASHKSKSSILPTSFWYISMIGSLLLLSYFTLGIRDPIGILSNSFPLLLAGYNVHLIKKSQQ